MSSTGNPGRSTGPAPVSDRVARLADAHHLGQLIAVRGADRPSRLAGVAVGLLVTVAAVVVLVLAAWLLIGQRVLGDGRVLHDVARLIVVGCLAFAVAGLVIAGRVLLDPAEATYLYAGGLLHRRRGRTRVAAWPEVVRVQTRRLGSSQFIAYTVQVRDGGWFDIGIRPEAVPNAFIDAVVEQARGHGRPVG